MDGYDGMRQQLIFGSAARPSELHVKGPALIKRGAQSVQPRWLLL